MALVLGSSPPDPWTTERGDVQNGVAGGWGEAQASATCPTPATVFGVVVVPGT